MKDRTWEKRKRQENKMKWNKLEFKEIKVNKAECEVVVFGTVRPLLSLWHELPLYPENRRGHEGEREEN